tara:strand:- start:36030 stop:36218 length:189 start_codon:yes stop_codon:yes gene_type:complete
MKRNVDKRLADLSRQQYIDYMRGTSDDFKKGYKYGKESTLGFFIWGVSASAMIGFSLGYILL